jgi:hypothetical protein
MLAAGLGSRFGGPKQLVQVGTDGAAIMDILLQRAAAVGFRRAVIVVAPGTEAVVRAHLDGMHASAPPDFPVELAVQPLRPGRSRPLGTADAALAARDAVAGSFVVVNADDLYPADAFALAAAHLRDAPPSEHALVAFRVSRTLVGDRAVSRALIRVGAAGELIGIREGTVVPQADGLQFETGSSMEELQGDECVSMNLWAFREFAFDAFAREVSEFVAEDREGEAFLPDAVMRLVGSGETVRVLVSESRCVGITHDQDIAVVRAALQ